MHKKNQLKKLGDSAPPLRVAEWVKGTPVQEFKTGELYIVEFWATWCAPCIAAMPHLSAIAEKYKDNVTVLAVDVKETQSPTAAKVKAFIDSKKYWKDIM